MIPTLVDQSKRRAEEARRLREGEGSERVSFTDGKPFVVTQEMLSMPWGGFRDGRKLRCLLCGAFFMVGTSARWVYANGGGPYRHGNFYVCLPCDGPDVLDRAAELAERAWAFWESSKPHPQATTTANGKPRVKS